MLLPQEIIRKKREGENLTAEEIAFFVKGIKDESVTEGQVAALAMAVFFQGMSMDERRELTRNMTYSGDVLSWKFLSDRGPVLDKHSSGGVGDKVSMMLAPIVAACGGFVPMISGRGLGHTGGTLDKLNSIPGYNTNPDIETFQKVTSDVGCAIIGQTADLAPADKRFYGIRDVTATVESVPLITASILSKKMAAGLDGLAMDIKCGNGAFCHSFEMANELAESIVTVANGSDLPTTALITDMNQVLGPTAGNAVEILESALYLRGDYREARLHEVTVDLCAEMLLLSGLSDDLSSARNRVNEVLDSGKACEVFDRMVVALGGPVDFCANAEKHLSLASVRREIRPPENGFISGMQTRDIGVAVVAMKGGRIRAADPVDHAVGFVDIQSVGSQVGPDHPPAAVVLAHSEEQAKAAEEAYLAALNVTDQKPETTAAILKRIAANG